MAGVKLYAKVENDAGQRVQELFVGDELVEPGRCYSAAFVTEQGVGPQYGANRQSTGVKAVAALEQCFARHRTMEAPLRGSVMLV